MIGKGYRQGVMAEFLLQEEKKESRNSGNRKGGRRTGKICPRYLTGGRSVKEGIE